jgi:hypothetical protein
MASKVINIQDARRKKREKTGWTLAEIRERAAQRAAINRTLERHEPAELASGEHMNSTPEQPEDDDE